MDQLRESLSNAVADASSQVSDAVSSVSDRVAAMAEDAAPESAPAEAVHVEVVDPEDDDEIPAV